MAKAKRFRNNVPSRGKPRTYEQPLLPEPAKPVPVRGAGRTIGRYDHFYVNQYESGLVAYELFPAGPS